MLDTVDTVYYTSFADLVSDYVTSSSFLIDNNDPPAISVNSPSGEQTADVTISYVLSDSGNQPLSILCEYSDDSGVSWATATITGSTSNIISANYSGAIIWNSQLDIYNSSAAVMFRITPSDFYDTGASSSTAEFLARSEEHTSELQSH